MPDSERDDAIRTVVERLGRSHPSGGVVIERAAILAEGADCAAVVAWITAHAGQPEAAIVSSKGGGLHGSRLSDRSGASDRPPARYVLPPGVLA
ncbi:MAG: hypothetical protein QOG63_2978 [Thermoleophilaceae bacterium]|jgi:hypothetical protein|nr:hypothetical protein [Thermoleophilaceae bacterium]